MPSESEIRATAVSQDEQWAQRWSEIRRRGRLYFVVRYGLFFHGFFFALAMTLTRALMGMSGPQPLTARPLVVSFILVLLFYGSLMGFTRWHQNEKRYRRVSKPMQTI